MRVTTTIIVLVGLSGAAPVTQALAQPEPPQLATRPPAARAREGGERRTMGGHVFTRTPLLRDPFAVTSFDVRTAVGVAEGDGPRFDLAGVVVGRSRVDLAAVAQAAEFQWAPLPFLALRAGGTASAITGTDAIAVVGVGARLRYEGLLGATISGQIGSRARVGAAVDVSWGRRDSFRILRAIARSIENRRIETGAVFQSDDVGTLRPTLSAAIALHRSLGLQLALVYEREFDADEEAALSRDAVGGAASLDFDLNPLVSLPLGLETAYRILVPREGDEDPTQFLEAGLFYTGRPNLDLGVLASFSSLTLTPAVNTESVSGSLVFRYYW